MAQDQQQQVSPQDAKAFLSNYGHDVAKLDDGAATKLYGDIYPNHTKALEEAVTKAKPNGETWRQDYVTAAKSTVKDLDDKKVLGRLERYTTPHAVVDALFQLQDRIGRGEMRSVMPKDAKPEELTKWRAENGLPEKPEGYQVQLTDGMVIGEEDKPILEAIKQSAHAMNLHPTQFNGMVDLYYDIIEQQTSRREEADTKARDTTEDFFRKQWGGDYRKNKAMIEAFVDMGPAGTKDLLFGARLADGTPLASHPGILQFLSDRSREVIDAATIVPSDSAQLAKSVQDEMNAIQALMGDKSSKYWKGPEAEKLQARFRELASAQEKITARSGGKK
jgi:hypothetical protein